MTTTTAPAAGAVAPRHHTPVRRPSLLRLTGVELRKLVDTRAGRWLLITIGLVAAAIVTLQLIYAPDADQTFNNFFVPSLLPIGVLLPVLGILSITSEWSQRTALTTYALVPRRERVVAAKLFAVVLAALASVLASLALAAVGTLVASATGGAGTWGLDASLLVNAVILQVTNVVIGAAFGLLLLNPPLAIVGYFLLPTLWGVLGEMVKPLRGPSEWLDTSKTMEPLFSSDALTGEQWGRIVVSLLVWMVLPLAAGLFRTLRREVS
ncbi:ABC-type transport system involved in multi-copper enzyme maturation permease subunit [Micromonospora vinacea]|uniref:ABC-type transport system involved in multi-copper enzyme maturation permease subunit n=1 Tax=Micromonospora vinacea TaxID=709878 RepID=A0ABS0K1N2_9ACTN|nr:ABC transporter permease [Micromonospora vinacea]MBG6102521.1 ABC-type transport system involved in multi-copper enzyme maturation permease subunit [Micromonospora vinacea]